MPAVDERKIKALLEKAYRDYLTKKHECKTPQEIKECENKYKVAKYSILMMNGVIPSDGNMY